MSLPEPLLTYEDRADVKKAREIDAALSLRKQMRLAGYVQPYRKRR